MLQLKKKVYQSIKNIPLNIFDIILPGLIAYILLRYYFLPLYIDMIKHKGCYSAIVLENNHWILLRKQQTKLTQEKLKSNYAIFVI